MNKEDLAQILQVSVRTIDRWVAVNRSPRGSRREVRFLWSRVLGSLAKGSVNRYED